MRPASGRRDHRQNSRTNLRSDTRSSSTSFVASEGVDLDNLTKPVLDTLFRPGPPNDNQAPWLEVTGRVFAAAHDSRVFELIQRKTLASGFEKQGVKVSVSWSRA